MEDCQSHLCCWVEKGVTIILGSDLSNYKTCVLPLITNWAIKSWNGVNDFWGEWARWSHLVIPNDCHIAPVGIWTVENVNKYIDSCGLFLVSQAVLMADSIFVKAVLASAVS